MSSSFWNRVCVLAGGARTLSRWRAELGSAYPRFEGWLAETGRAVGHWRCDRCGCNHKVLPAEEGAGYVAVCRCDGGCAVHTMTTDEARAWVINQKALVESLVAVLPVSSRVKAIGGHGLWELGVVWLRGGRRATLLVSLAGKRVGLEASLGDLFAHGLRDFILLVADASWCGSDLGARLESVGGESFGLGEFVAISEQGLRCGDMPGRILGEGPARAGREPPFVEPYAIQRGVNSWRVVFDGIELPGLGKDRGMFFVAYLVGHAGGDPIHALELEAKVARFYRKDCGLTEIVDPSGEKAVALSADAIPVERDLNLDNERMAELLREEERKALAIVESGKSSSTARAEALEKVESIRAYRANRFGKNSSPANDAARRVRTAIDRLIGSLRKTTPVSARQGQALTGFADYVEKSIRQASANLWPRTGLRSRKSKWLPGHFVCEKIEGIEWVVM